MTFAEKVLTYIHPGDMVLDLGAGNGWFVQECLRRDAIVTAVDRMQNNDIHEDVDWHAMDVRDFIEHLSSTKTFQCIFSRNLIQFLESDWVVTTLLPTLIQHLAPQGILAIQTFYRDPEPSFERSVSSLYTVDDLHKAVPTMKLLHSREFQESAVDKAGVSRTFFLAQSILRKT